jgi:hypothetical protein
MSGLWASLVLIGVALGVGAVLAAAAAAAITVIYRAQNRPAGPEAAPGDTEVTAGRQAAAVTAGPAVPPQGSHVETANRESLRR